MSEKSDTEINNYIAPYESPTDDINQSLLSDVDSDGEINIKDATMIQKCVVGLEQLDENQSICADTNGDGTINVNDATLIQKYVVKLIVKL